MLCKKKVVPCYECNTVLETPSCAIMDCTFYRDKRRDWRWRVKARNGRIVATSGGDGYKNLKDAKKMALKVLNIGSIYFWIER